MPGDIETETTSGSSFYLRAMQITLVEPFYGGSHKQWADALIQRSSHSYALLSMSAHHWKWRMHGAAITLGRQFLATKKQTDLILATDMLDLGLFLSFTRNASAGVPTAIYFHENQINYPWSPKDRDVKAGRDHHYGFINYTSALVADFCLFNSAYHRDAFLTALPKFLKQFPDHNNADTSRLISEKSKVLSLALDLRRFDAHRSTKHSRNSPPIILWNHRWEFDKGPEEFFNVLFQLSEDGEQFQLVILGEELDKSPDIFAEARERLRPHILHWGFCTDQAQYAKWLWRADILPVTSIQDFFGGSIIEAIYCNVFPLLPQRLAYPEHIPEPLRPRYFYSDSKDLFDRIKWLLQNPDFFEENSLSKEVSKYDWEEAITDYDTIFETMVSKKLRHAK